MFVVLDFKNLEILFADGIYMVEMHHHAIFYQTGCCFLEIPYLWFFRFYHGGHHLSWICLAGISTAHEEYLLVFITVQNLVVIGAVIVVIWKF